MCIYTAKIYIEDEIIDERNSDDLDGLYIWMIAKADSQKIPYKGIIINNYTKEVVRTFKTSSIE
ncbi:hypothetical protein [Legionella sp. PC997]|uniref:hypothetical protein n=1 Tax=Legionella sp. PC997 TaxID=2755562 RepID=UPI0015FD6A6E|nr:hypothetical protein [Legionella sp. PC997]QMT62068.1 hypothetical protein HBNCFIEN_03476 [Legionella sp. PC997]